MPMIKKNISKEIDKKIGSVLQLQKESGEIFSVGLSANESTIRLTLEDQTSQKCKYSDFESISFDSEGEDDEFTLGDYLSTLDLFILNNLKRSFGAGNYISILYLETNTMSNFRLGAKISLTDFNGVGIDGILIAAAQLINHGNSMIAIAFEDKKYPIAVF
jgi:hypothetical protein